jgi:hypothetical protein
MELAGNIKWAHRGQRVHVSKSWLQPAAGFQRSVGRLRFGCSAVELHRLRDSFAFGALLRGLRLTISTVKGSGVLHEALLADFDLRAYHELLTFKTRLRSGL